MNRNQTVVFWIAIILVALIGLCPPQVRWTRETWGPASRQGMEWAAKYHTDTGSLLGYWVAVGSVAGGFIYALRDKKDNKKHQLA